MTRKECIDAAAAIISGDRYGRPERNFSDIAVMWSIYLKQDINAEDVAAMMVLLKVARISSGMGGADNWVDIAGYAACGCEIETGGNHDQD